MTLSERSPRPQSALPVAELTSQRERADLGLPASTLERDPPPRVEWRAALTVGSLGALALGILGALVRRETVPRGDDRIYEDIARHPLGVHTFPFGYRLGLPALVHVLPFDHTTSFVALALLFAGGAAAGAFLLMRELGVSRALGAALAILMCVSPPFLIVLIREGRNTDIATVFFMVIASWFAVRRQYRSLAVTLLVGVAFREAVLFVAPLAYALWASRPLDRRAATRALLVAAPALAAYAAIRVGIHTIGEAQVPGYGGSLLGERLQVIRSGLDQPFQQARRLFTVYGPLWLLAPLALRDMSFARRGCVLVAAALVSMTFALDWGRMILLAAPVFYPAAAHALDRRRSWRVPALAACLLLALGYAAYMDRSGTRTGIIENPAPPYPVQ
jgi:hypothetical protein